MILIRLARLSSRKEATSCCLPICIMNKGGTGGKAVNQNLQRRINNNRPLPQTRTHQLRSRHTSATPLEEASIERNIHPTTNCINIPSRAELRNLFIASSIPMIGFGFMDNFVMIQAGQYIDSTLGVTLGLATLTAAAAGTLFSY